LLLFFAGDTDLWHIEDLFIGYGTDWVDITGKFYQLVWSGKSERHFHQKNIVVSNMQLYELDIKLK